MGGGSRELYNKQLILPMEKCKPAPELSRHLFWDHYGHFPPTYTASNFGGNTKP